MSERKNDLQKLVAASAFVLLVIVIFNTFSISAIDNAISGIEAARKPAKLSLVSIEPECELCYDINNVISGLGSYNTEITSEVRLKSVSKEAAELIQLYGIEKLPALILKGETEKVSIPDMVKREGALVYDSALPPYVESKTGKVVGAVRLIELVDSDCKLCYDFTLPVESLKASGIIFSSIKKIEFDSAEGNPLVKNYGIRKIPSLLLSADIDAYPIARNLRESGFNSSGEYYVIESRASYLDAGSGKVRGLANLTMLTDASCQECYDVNMHKQILAQMGMALESEKTADINSTEGVKLLGLYNITSVPTIIIRGDLDIYESFKPVWLQVGTVETDGTYIFRDISALGEVVYKDLTTGIIIQS